MYAARAEIMCYFTSVASMGYQLPVWVELKILGSVTGGMVKASVIVPVKSAPPFHPEGHHPEEFNLYFIKKKRKKSGSVN